MSLLESAAMPNDRLRDALLRRSLSYEDVARRAGVDPKTVERWVTQSRLPYPKHRNSLAALVRESEVYLWPNAVSDDRRAEISDSEIIRIYPKRAHVPIELWTDLFSGQSGEIDALMFAGLYLPEQQPGLSDLLCEKAKSGSTVRILMGKPDSDPVLRRGEEEGIGDALSARIRQTLTYFKTPDHDPIDLRLHETTLYNSIFRFDDEMLVVAHVIGVPGPHAPVLHLRRIPGGELFETYEGAFERVWKSAVSATPYLRAA